MTYNPRFPIPRLSANQYGSITFEEHLIPCAFAGEPGRFTAYIAVQGVCEIVGLPLEMEIDRIQSNHLIVDGLFLVPFGILDSDGKTIMVDYPALSLTRLHTWLALIPPETVADEDLRQKLVTTQKELTDLIYGYFGRTIMPPEMVEEDETYLSLDKKAFYEKLKEAAQMAERMGVIENRIGKIEAQIHGLSMTVSSTMEGEHIEIDQQEQFRTIIGILGRRYEEKHGKGTFYNVEASLKKQYNFTFYRTITRQQWGQLIRECVQMFHSLFPKGTRLPDVLEHALNSINQDRLF